MCPFFLPTCYLFLPIQPANTKQSDYRHIKIYEVCLRASGEGIWWIECVQLKIQLANPLLPYLNLERMSDGTVTTMSRNLR